MWSRSKPDAVCVATTIEPDNYNSSENFFTKGMAKLSPSLVSSSINDYYRVKPPPLTPRAPNRQFSPPPRANSYGFTNYTTSAARRPAESPEALSTHDEEVTMTPPPVPAAAIEEDESYVKRQQTPRIASSLLPPMDIASLADIFQNSTSNSTAHSPHSLPPKHPNNHLRSRHSPQQQDMPLRGVPFIPKSVIPSFGKSKDYKDLTTSAVTEATAEPVTEPVSEPAPVETPVTKSRFSYSNTQAVDLAAARRRRKEPSAFK